MCGAGMGSRFGVVSNLGVAVAVDSWELRPRWEDQRIDVSGVHGLQESHAETGLVVTAFDGRRIVLGGQRVHRFVKALLVQRVEELGGSDGFDGRIRDAGMLR